MLSLESFDKSLTECFLSDEDSSVEDAGNRIPYHSKSINISNTIETTPAISRPKNTAIEDLHRAICTHEIDAREDDHSSVEKSYYDDGFESRAVQAARKLEFSKATKSTLTKESSSSKEKANLDIELLPALGGVLSFTNKSSKKSRRWSLKRARLKSIQHENEITEDDNDTEPDHGHSRHFQMLQRVAIKSGSDRPVFEGYLTKQGVFRKNWRRRWCIIDEGGLIRYYKPNEYVPRGTIDTAHRVRLESINSAFSAIGAGNRKPDREEAIVQDEDLDTATSWPRCVPNRYCRFAVRGPCRTYYFYADDTEQAEKWKSLIGTLINKIRTKF